MSPVVRNRSGTGVSPVNERRYIERVVLPPNKGIEPTVKIVTPFAGAKAAPLLPAAHPKC
jgi:hypothetical protein